MFSFTALPVLLDQCTFKFYGLKKKKKSLLCIDFEKSFEYHNFCSV